MNVHIVPAQMEAHIAHKARQARIRQAARNVKPKRLETRKYTFDAQGCQIPVFPWPKPVFEPVYVDHDSHVVAFRTKGISFSRIKHDAIAASGIQWSQIISNRRDFAIVRWRQAICRAAYELTGMSLPEIGRMLGNKDHTTILHATRKVDECRLAGNTEEVISPTGLTFFVRTKYMGKKPKR